MKLGFVFIYCLFMFFFRQLKNRFLDAWQSLIGKTKQECITLYLCMAKNWATFGAKLFKAKVGLELD